MFRGQRYHVVVDGLDDPYKHDKYGNFWMRVVPARKCSKFAYGPDEQMGIVRYNKTNKNDPLSEPPLYDIACADEPKEKLKPHRKWTVGNPSNIGIRTGLGIQSLCLRLLDPTWFNESAIPKDKSYIFEVAMDNTFNVTPYNEVHGTNKTVQVATLFLLQN